MSFIDFYSSVKVNGGNICIERRIFGPPKLLCYIRMWTPFEADHEGK